ncbi:nuclease-related domain-containing protein [Alkalihalobacillus pseudalcaliphilus]|uniref:nuclease-related domain-containing protein n=1 Tax=Alkalihalobacillus pseudalcaliphilus TaxID=79884 RepID=UPI00069FCD12|nr:nuclease-related domain-containing protein [Alkalihalobacillus pseudalcaliphilus]
MKRRRPLPTDLQVGSILAQRNFPLSPKETEKLSHAEKGYLGEVNFDNWLLEDLPDNWYVLHDLWLTAKDSTLQIDSLVITPKDIFLFEVKNYSGSYFLEGDRLLTESQYEIKNPHIQLKRTETLLRQLLLNQFGKATPTIKSYVCFINPDFYLYNAPLNAPHFLFCSLLKKFKKNMVKEHSQSFNKNRNICDFLLNSQLIKSPFKPTFEYNINHLTKGIVCYNCNEVFTPHVRKARYLFCPECNFQENWSSAIVRAVEEYMILFPEKKITSREIATWCAVPSSRSIRFVLKKFYRKNENFGNTYYTKITE